MNHLDFGIKNFRAHLDLVDKKLKQMTPENIRGTSRLLEASGKRLRPSLVIAVAVCSGRDIDEGVIDAATAVELVHLASLIHDDIMDGGKLRWGEPTINSREGIDWAILAGDYLLAKGCALANSVSAEAGVLMAETIASLCEGQALELKDRFNTERTLGSLRQTIIGKTSSLFIAAVGLGGIIAELDSKQLRILSTFAENFGIAYQYLDDIADFTESTKSAGKSVGNDIREGNYSLPVILSLHGSYASELKKLLQQNNISAPLVLEVLKKDDSLSRAKKEAQENKQKAYLELKKLESIGLADTLKIFVDY